LLRFGVWSGIDDALHHHVPRTASRLGSPTETLEAANAGVWHPSVPASRSRGRTMRLASDAAMRVHWVRELLPAHTPDWIVSPQAALAPAAHCMHAEHQSPAIDSALHERVLQRREVDAVMASLPNRSAMLVDRFTGRPESGVESLFVRRISHAGEHIEPQVGLG